MARSLKEDSDLNVRIVGLAYDAMDPGIYMDWVVDKSFMMPYPSGNAEAYLDRLLYIKGRCGLDCVIPNLDAELPCLIKWSKQLHDRGIRTFLPSLEQFRLRGKDCLPELAEQIGIRCPRTEVVTSLAMFNEALQKSACRSWSRAASTRPIAPARCPRRHRLLP